MTSSHNVRICIRLLHTLYRMCERDVTSIEVSPPGKLLKNDDAVTSSRRTVSSESVATFLLYRRTFALLWWQQYNYSLFDNARLPREDAAYAGSPRGVWTRLDRFPFTHIHIKLGVSLYIYVRAFDFSGCSWQSALQCTRGNR